MIQFVFVFLLYGPMTFGHEMSDFLVDYLNSFNSIPTLVFIGMDEEIEYNVFHFLDTDGLIKFPNAASITPKDAGEMKQNLKAIMVITKDLDEAKQADQALSLIRRKKFLILDFRGVSSSRFSLNTTTTLIQKTDEALEEHFDEFIICDRLMEPLKILTRIWIKNPLGGFKILRQFSAICPNPLKNRRIKVSAFGVQPFVAFQGPHAEITGVDTDILEMLSHIYRFDFQTKWGNSFGSKNRTTGQWDGVSGEILSGEADIAVGAMIATDLDRREIVDFLDPPYPIEFYLISTKPKPLKPYLNILKPFDIYCWTFLLLTLVLASFSIWLINKLSTLNVDMTTWDSFMSALLILIDQSGSHRISKSINFVSLSMIICLTFWLLLSVVLNSAYSGNLNAHLVKVDYQRAINEEKDVLEMGRLLYLPVSAALYTSVATSPLKLHQDLLSVTLNGGGLYSIQRGWLSREKEEELIENGGVLLFLKEPVYVMHKRFIQTYGFQPLRVGKKVIFSYSSGFMIPKGFPFKDELNRIIHRIVSMGFVHHLKKKYYPTTALMQENPSQDLVKLSMVHLLGAFLLYLIGIFLSFAAFKIELIRGKMKKKQNKNWPRHFSLFS